MNHSFLSKILTLSIIILVSILYCNTFVHADDERAFNDKDLLDKLQYSTCMYMWENSFPESGMVRERNDESCIATTGGTGFGIAALVVGVERGWINRQEAVNRLCKLMLFLRDKTQCKNLHGAFPHWINGITGETIPFSEKDNGADIVETALLVQGMLIARSYFNRDDEYTLRKYITEIWENIEWEYFSDENGLFWHLSKNNTFDMNMRISGFNEGLIAYILALSSPTHHLNSSILKGWYSSDGYASREYYGYHIDGAIIYTGPLFFTHYSFIGIDPRYIADKYVPYGYMKRNIIQALINRAYCLYVAPKENSFSEGLWGLTSSETPRGYLYSSPVYESATIAPTAALSSMPYTPEYSLRVLRNLYSKHPTLWGKYGPYDAINLRDNWISHSYLAIDQLPITCMIENYRTGLLWRLFSENDEIKKGLERGGFHLPKMETGFAYMISAYEGLSESNSRAVCDVCVHPDDGHYKIAFFTETSGNVVFRLYDTNEALLWDDTIYTEAGLHELRIPSKFSFGTNILKLEMAFGDKSCFLPVRLN